MKKALAILLSIVMAVCMTTSAFAIDVDANNDFTISNTRDSNAPTITEAKFYHKGVIASLANRLQVSWTSVEGADSYYIEVTRGDGTINTYSSNTNSFMLQNSTCPTVNVNGNLVSGTVRVRAIIDSVPGTWSESETIGCDKIHIISG